MVLVTNFDRTEHKKWAIDSMIIVIISYLTTKIQSSCLKITPLNKKDQYPQLVAFFMHGPVYIGITSNLETHTEFELNLNSIRYITTQSITKLLFQCFAWKSVASQWDLLTRSPTTGLKLKLETRPNFSLSAEIGQKLWQDYKSIGGRQ